MVDICCFESLLHLLWRLRIVSQRLGYLNVWGPVGGAIWRGLEGTVLLEKIVTGWERGVFEILKPRSISNLFPFFFFVLPDEDVTFELASLILAAMPAACCHAFPPLLMDSSSSGAKRQNKLFLKLCWSL